MSPNLPSDEVVSIEKGETVERPRKRRIEEEDDEERDTVDFGLPTPRRGRKEGRRVSGVYREIRSLQNIGQNADVMNLVFNRMPTKDMLLAGCSSPMWLTVAYHVLRKRLQNSPFVRLYQNESPCEFLWINWELHFHDELLGFGLDDDGGQMEVEGSAQNPPEANSSVQAIISVGNRAAYSQFIHEDAKLPFRQDHIYAICQDAITTCSKSCCVGTIDNRFGFGSMIVESLFVPKSEHFTLKGFGVELSKDTWTTADIHGKVMLYEEDLGDNQTLKALLLIKYAEMEGLRSFIQQFTNLYSSAELLVGDAEEVGSNRIGAREYSSAVGFAFFAGAGATVAVYTVDFLKPDSGAVLERMKRQVESAKYNFAFMFSHDQRGWIDNKECDPNDSMDWSCSVRPEPPIDHILLGIHNWLPGVPLVGVKSMFPVEAKTASENSNVDGEASTTFTFGFILVSYN